MTSANWRGAWILGVALALGPAMAEAASYEALRAARPELFHDKTGYRIERQRSPTPDDIPAPTRVISPEEAKALLEGGALALDVFAASQSRYDDLDGTWLVSKTRLSLPGAVWLPETGRGFLTEIMERYLRETLHALTEGDLAHPIVVFCVADCWMSWNASQRISALGYTSVHWFRLGTDGWLDIGETLEPVDPVPVNVD